MKNKKGFTLIELMGTITILAIISLIIVPIVDKNIKKSKDDLYNIQIDNIRIAGINYFTDNPDEKPTVGNYAFKTLDELIELNYMDKNIKNPKTGNSFTEKIYIQLSNSTGTLKYSVCPFEENCIDYQ